MPDVLGALFMLSLGYHSLQPNKFIRYYIPYTGKFLSLNLHENGNFNNFVNDPHGQHKGCGMAIFCGVKFAKFVKIKQHE